MTDAALPDLWLDWCVVTGNRVDIRDEAVLEEFARQAAPSQKLLSALRSPAAAPTWPPALRDDAFALERLVHGGTSRINDPDTGWIARLRLRRLLFSAVLLAPPDQGGLGLSRGQVRDLTAQRLRELRPDIGRADEEASCPACAVWSWLDIIGTNNGWSQGALRELGQRRDTPAGERHRHELDDPSPDWLAWPGLNRRIFCRRSTSGATSTRTAQCTRRRCQAWCGRW
ncbi:hypothetical protein BS329_35770 [Amycolatopsis coloradensis]|uniref:Uncharacterized protein n=1 Tax=Amycolatopsis coloradensis TaxID=76021 RepID=A0A1R0KGG4_9PSEU|nr:hypothetical protein [Amycolatopsis coloradensis]OLZ44671.1 hypothetical protein BS329_35770 [Amycolatopsis coloradensis]